MSNVGRGGPVKALEHPARRIGQLTQFGSFSLAYSTLQAGLRYFETDDGYLAYAFFRGKRFVLSDPVAPPPAWPQLVQRFLREAPHVCFCQVSRPMAALLAGQGFYVNEFGLDYQLAIDTYDFKGTKKEHIRYAESRLNRDGFRIAELSEVAVDWDAVRAVSDSWKQQRTVNRVRETGFLSRPLVLAAEPDTRKFFVLAGSRVVAFVFFDPIYRERAVVGYLSNAKRYLDAAPDGFDFAVTKFALERFRREGKTILHLGAVPLCGVEDAEFPANRVTSRLFRYVYPRKWVYNFRGIAEHKARFRGTVEKTYLASRSAFPLGELIQLVRVCKVF